MIRIDLNADMGESFGIYKIGNDEELMKYITSANIACGMHGGDPIVMDKTVCLAKQNGVSIGAHPGYPDLQGFGRRKMDMSLKEIECFVLYQLGSISAFCRSNGVELKHVKPHGVLYNLASEDIDIALSIANAVKMFDANLILVGLYNSQLIQAGKQVSLKTAREVFADRAYDDNGLLVSRKFSGSVFDSIDKVIEQAVNIIKYNKVKTINGNIIDIYGDTLCIHGDNPKAVEFANSIVEEFKKNSINILPLSEILK